MKNIIIATVAIALVTLSASSPVMAKKFGRLGNPSVNFSSVNGPAGQSDDSATPGDAFFPDTAAVGDPKAECLAQGGRPVRVAGEYDFTWSCKL